MHWVKRARWNALYSANQYDTDFSSLPHWYNIVHYHYYHGRGIRLKLYRSSPHHFECWPSNPRVLLFKINWQLQIDVWTREHLECCSDLLMHRLSNSCYPKDHSREIERQCSIVNWTHPPWNRDSSCVGAFHSNERSKSKQCASVNLMQSTHIHVSFRHK